MSEAPPADGGRRRFLKVATCALGGGIAGTVLVPATRYLLYPVDTTTVTTGDEPIDVMPEARIKKGAPPLRVGLVAPSERDAWGSVQNVPLGAAWVLRDDGGLKAWSAVCPHLGCSIGYDAGDKKFRCPCHDSSFSLAGERLGGPTERGMDPLPWDVKDGRLRITWVRYKVGGSTRETT
ncbi:MAG TPA: Rieske 2Fe-2S domain-containing protein [Kofleriaceae bacterium]|jgi:Rieske Fe-S protein|nr:Rieske 2Fe-2S domain-containing protein [Kofleriaceae bacterium]